MTDTSGAETATEPGAVAATVVDVNANPIETLAAKFGWRQKSDDFQGEWLDATAFLDKQPDRLKAAKDKAAKAADTAQRASRAAEAALRKSTAQMKKELTEQIRAAADAGETDKVMEATERLAEVVRAPTGEVEDFKSRNSWFDTDDEATAYAVSLTNRLAAQGLSVKEQLDQAEKAVQKRFPELFNEQTEDRPAKKAPMVVQGQTNAPLSPRKKGLADIPAQIRSQLPRLCKKMGITTDEYVSEYWKENA